jgi:hypothetical protein
MKGDQHSKALLEELSAAATRMLRDASESMAAANAPLVNPSVATPESLGEMITMGGFQASGPHGGIVQDQDWGAGHQAFFLYQVLHTLDTNYGRFFGWRQATIWGLEEPESALHRDLEVQLAAKLREWAHEESHRLQILSTTHSSVFAMAADSGHWCGLAGNQTVLERMESSILVRAAEARGVSSWVHPVLSFPWNPVVLVEGSIDEQVLRHVANVARSDQLHFLSLPELDVAEKTGGRDAVIGYLRRNQKLIQNRPRSAPLIVVFDWETGAQDLARAQEAYGPSSDRYVIRMNASYCNVSVGKDFKGIERFYPPRILLEAHQAGDMVLGVAEGKPFSISADQLRLAKGSLLARMRGVDSVEELRPLLLVIRDIEMAVREEGPFQLELPGP